MPPEAVPSNASVASTGLGIRYIGRDPTFAYAYSGEVLINNTTETCLLFTSGSGFIHAEFFQAINYGNIGNGKFTGFTIKLNDLEIFVNRESTRNYGDNESNNPEVVRFIIPPLTKVETTGYSDQASDNPFFHSIVGRVYGAE